jgi:hypothetical protein
MAVEEVVADAPAIGGALLPDSRTALIGESSCRRGQRPRMAKKSIRDVLACRVLAN